MILSRFENLSLTGLIDNIGFNSDDEMEKNELYPELKEISKKILMNFIYIKSSDSLYKILIKLTDKIVSILKKTDLKKKSIESMLKLVIESINKSDDYSVFYIFPSEIINYLSYLISLVFINNNKDRNVRTLKDFYYKFDIVTERKKFKNLLQNNSNRRYSMYSEPSKFEENNDKNNNLIRVVKVNEFTELVNLFSTIRKINVILPNFEIEEISFIIYIFMEFNYGWLFKNAIEYELNLINTHILAELDQEEINYNFPKTYCYLLVELFYFLGIINKVNIQNLTLYIPYAFTEELNKMITDDLKYKKNNADINHYYHLFNFIEYTFINMKSINLEFNCLDNFTFQNIINFLNKNSHVSSMSINLFPKEYSDILLSEPQLRKFALFEVQQNNKNKNNSDLIEEIKLQHDTEYYLNFLFKPFQDNFNSFFRSVAANAIDLTELKIFFELPDFLILNSHYCECIVEFIFNLFFLLESNFTHIINLEINADNFFFDGGKFIGIPDRIENCRMENCKRLKNLIFKMKIYNIDNFAFFLPRSIQALTLGDIDIDTFSWFIEDLKMLKNLEYLSVSIWNGKYEIDNNFEVIQKIFNEKYISSKLIELHLDLKLFLTWDLIKNIFTNKIIHKSYLQNINITFNYEKIIDAKNNKKNLLIQLQDIIYKNNNSIKYYQRIGFNQRQTIIKLLVKKHIILCHDLDKDIPEHGFDDRKTIINIFSFLYKLVNKSIKIKII